MHRFNVPSLFTVLASHDVRLSNICKHLKHVYKDDIKLLEKVNALSNSLNEFNQLNTVHHLISLYKLYLGNINIDSIDVNKEPNINYCNLTPEMTYPLLKLLVRRWNILCKDMRYSDAIYSTNINFKTIMRDITYIVTTLFEINQSAGSHVLKRLELVNYIDGLIEFKENGIAIYEMDYHHVLSLLNNVLTKDVIFDDNNLIGKEITTETFDYVVDVLSEDQDLSFTMKDVQAISLVLSCNDLNIAWENLLNKSEFYIRRYFSIVWYLDYVTKTHQEGK